MGEADYSVAIDYVTRFGSCRALRPAQIRIHLDHLIFEIPIPPSNPSGRRESHQEPIDVSGQLLPLQDAFRSKEGMHPGRKKGYAIRLE